MEPLLSCLWRFIKTKNVADVAEKVSVCPADKLLEFLDCERGRPRRPRAVGAADFQPATLFPL